MGGRLSLQRTTRPLVPANFRDRKTRPSRALLAGAANARRLAAARAPVQPYAKICLSTKALAPDGWKPGDFAQIATRPMNLTTG
jgi:hypothetical protein